MAYSTFVPEHYEDPDFDYLCEPDDGDPYYPDDDSYLLMSLRDDLGGNNDSDD